MIDYLNNISLPKLNFQEYIEQARRCICKSCNMVEDDKCIKCYNKYLEEYEAIFKTDK